jgi:hypothetical protein
MQKSTLERVAIQRICATIQKQLNQVVEQDLSQIVTRRHSAQVNTHFAGTSSRTFSALGIIVVYDLSGTV